jgi:hypothetical protein
MTAAQAGSTLRNYTSQAWFLLEYYRAGMRALAEGTGGQMAADTDTGAALERYVNDLQGYYLLTYKPSRAEQYFAPTAADHPPFRYVKIHVARPGMHVRSYAGYIAAPGAEPETSAYGEISKALFSPFSSAGVALGLSRKMTLSHQRAGSVAGAASELIKQRMQTARWQLCCSESLYGSSEPCRRWGPIVRWRRCQRCAGGAHGTGTSAVGYHESEKESACGGW